VQSALPADVLPPAVIAGSVASPGVPVPVHRAPAATHPQGSIAAGRQPAANEPVIPVSRVPAGSATALPSPQRISIGDSGADAGMTRLVFRQRAHSSSADIGNSSPAESTAIVRPQASSPAEKTGSGVFPPALAPIPAIRPHSAVSSSPASPPPLPIFRAAIGAGAPVPVPVFGAGSDGGGFSGSSATLRQVLARLPVPPNDDGAPAPSGRQGISRYAIGQAATEYPLAMGGDSVSPSLVLRAAAPADASSPSGWVRPGLVPGSTYVQRQAAPTGAASPPASSPAFLPGAAAETNTPAPLRNLDLQQVAERVYQLIARKLRNERDRRGY
jgi:hypothetical protein